MTTVQKYSVNSMALLTHPTDSPSCCRRRFFTSNSPQAYQNGQRLDLGSRGHQRIHHPREVQASVDFALTNDPNTKSTIRLLGVGQRTKQILTHAQMGHAHQSTGLLVSTHFPIFFFLFLFSLVIFRVFSFFFFFIFTFSCLLLLPFLLFCYFFKIYLFLKHMDNFQNTCSFLFILFFNSFLLYLFLFSFSFLSFFCFYLFCGF